MKSVNLIQNSGKVGLWLAMLGLVIYMLSMQGCITSPSWPKDSWIKNPKAETVLPWGRASISADELATGTAAKNATRFEQDSSGK